MKYLACLLLSKLEVLRHEALPLSSSVFHERRTTHLLLLLGPELLLVVLLKFNIPAADGGVAASWLERINYSANNSRALTDHVESQCHEQQLYY